MVWVVGGRERERTSRVFISQNCQTPVCVCVCVCVCVYKSISCVQLILLTFASSWVYLFYSLLEHFQTLMEL